MAKISIIFPCCETRYNKQNKLNASCNTKNAQDKLGKFSNFMQLLLLLDLVLFLSEACKPG